MDPAYPPQNKGLSGLAWLGIGCGGMIALIVIIGALIGLVFGSRIKAAAPLVGKVLAYAEKDPARGAATLMVSAGQGNFEMSAEDEANKRYTVRDKRTGTLFTFYWDAQTHTVKSVKGDFSAIPDGASPPPH